MERLIIDACCLLNLEAEGQLSREEYEQWRDRWVKQTEALLLEREKAV